MRRALLALLRRPAGGRCVRGAGEGRDPDRKLRNDRELASLAGDHPDLSTHFELGTRAPKSPRTSSSTPRRGYSATPMSSPAAAALDFALQRCAPNSQVGPDHDPRRLRRRLRTPARDRPDLRRRTGPPMTPPASPSTRRSWKSRSRSRSRFAPGPTTACGSPSPASPSWCPLKKRRHDLLGLPGQRRTTTSNASRRARPGNPAGCPGSTTPAASPTPTRRQRADRAVHRQPARSARRPMTTTLDVETYQDPGDFSTPRAATPDVTECERQTFQPVAQARADHRRGRLAVGPRPRIQRSAGAGTPRRPRSSGPATDPSRRADDQPRRRRWAERLLRCRGELGTEEPSHAPTTPRSARSSSESESLPGDLQGSIYFGQPVPGNQYRLFMFADGFGIHAKLIGKLLPDPKTGQITAEVRRPAAAALRRVRHAHVRLRPRGVRDADPAARSTPSTTRLFPWNATLPDAEPAVRPQHQPRPGRRRLPGRTRPFQPRLNAGTSNPDAGGFSNFTLKLDRDDGDQFLGDLNFTMPPGLTGSLRGITYCPEAAIAAAAQNLGRTEQAARAARRRARSAPRTSPPAPAATRSTRSGRCIWPARSRARR